MAWKDHLIQGLPVDLGVYMYMDIFLGRRVLASRDSQGDHGSKEVKNHRQTWLSHFIEMETSSVSELVVAEVGLRSKVLIPPSTSLPLRKATTSPNPAMLLAPPHQRLSTPLPWHCPLTSVLTINLGKGVMCSEIH